MLLLEYQSDGGEEMKYRIDTGHKRYDRYYGLSSVPTSWNTQRVRFQGVKDNIVVYQTKSGWLVSKVATDTTPGGFMTLNRRTHLADPAYKSRAGAGGYGYNTMKEAIQAYIEQRLS